MDLDLFRNFEEEKEEEKDEEKMQCPICKTLFPMSLIEDHAEFCEESKTMTIEEINSGFEYKDINDYPAVPAAVKIEKPESATEESEEGDLSRGESFEDKDEVRKFNLQQGNPKRIKKKLSKTKLEPRKKKNFSTSDIKENYKKFVEFEKKKDDSYLSPFEVETNVSFLKKSY